MGGLTAFQFEETNNDAEPSALHWMSPSGENYQGKAGIVSGPRKHGVAISETPENLFGNMSVMALG